MDEGDLASAGGVQAGEDDVPDREVTSDPQIWTNLKFYRDGLIGGPLLLNNSQATLGRSFSQPRARLIVHLFMSNNRTQR